LISVFVSIVIPIITYLNHKKTSANQLRKLIIAYLESFEIKVYMILEKKVWDKTVSFEEYNKKNFDVLESCLEQINILTKKENKAYIKFVIKYKTRENFNLTYNLDDLIEFKNDLKEIKAIISNI